VRPCPVEGGLHGSAGNACSTGVVVSPLARGSSDEVEDDLDLAVVVVDVEFAAASGGPDGEQFGLGRDHRGDGDRDCGIVSRDTDARDGLADGLTAANRHAEIALGVVARVIHSQRHLRVCSRRFFAGK
jgi:hypothetical protein